MYSPGWTAPSRRSSAASVRGRRPAIRASRTLNRYHLFTYKQFGNGATLDNGFLVLSKVGHIAVRWSRPPEGTPMTVTISREADGYYVCFSCADVPVQVLPATGQETGIDMGLASFATLSNGVHIFNPRWYRKADRRPKTAQRRVSQPRKEATAGAKRSSPSESASQGEATAAGLPS